MKEIHEIFVPFSTINLEDESNFEKTKNEFSYLLISNIICSKLHSGLQHNRIIKLLPNKMINTHKVQFPIEVQYGNIEKMLYVTFIKGGTIAYSVFSRKKKPVEEWERIISGSLLTKEEFDEAFPRIIESLS
jgi:hypothetical protein